MGGAAFGGVFDKKLKQNSWSCFVFVFSSWHFEKIVKDGIYQYIMGQDETPLINTISAVDEIKKVSCLDFDGKSVTTSSQRNPHPFTFWRCLDFTQSSSRQNGAETSLSYS